MKFLLLIPTTSTSPNLKILVLKRGVSPPGDITVVPLIWKMSCHLAFVALYFIEPTGYRKGLLDGWILLVREM